MKGSLDLPSTPGPDLGLLVCPTCHGDLAFFTGNRLRCGSCGQSYDVIDGIANLQVARGFDDEDHLERWNCEECTGAHMIKHYMAPLLESLFPDADRAALQLLSIGCGVGVDVEMLNALGYQCHGFDVGNRVKSWARRSNPRAYTRAAVQCMPFRDRQFDFAFLNCVLPHVGVVGDSQTVADDYAEERARAVAETIRVVRPGGYILLSNPNRLCPVDLFHRRNEHSHVPRFHRPDEPFLQSFDDHHRAFVVEGGCRQAETLPPANFWGFSESSKSSRYLVGKMLQASIRVYFGLLSARILAPLRRGALNPWLIVLVTR